MGAISDQMMSDGFQCTQALHGQPVAIISGADAGKTFTATILVMPNLEFQGEVVQDNRERMTALFDVASWPQNVKPEDDMKDSYGVVWRFVKRINNPNDSAIEWEVTKIIPGTDN